MEYFSAITKNEIPSFAKNEIPSFAKQGGNWRTLY
jgi:hypothetical protein